MDAVGGLITPDFSEVKDRVESGIYKTRIVGHKIGSWAGRDGKKDTHYVGWTLETFGENEDKNNGRRIFHNTAINGAGAFRLKDLYKAAMREELSSEFDPTMLYGREVEVTVAPQLNKPEFTEVKTVKPL